MKKIITDAPSRRNKRNCRVGLWLSKSEKDRLKDLTQSCKCTSMSQFIRDKCLYNPMTNSELTDKLMSIIGKKFWAESSKNSTCRNKTWIKRDLKKPESKIFSETHYEKKLLFTKKKSNKIKRKCYLAFLLTEYEKEQLKRYTKKFGFRTMSKYIRNRCFRHDITRSDILEIISSFIAQKFTEVAINPDSRLQWRKKKIKEQFMLNPILTGLDKTQREKFENSMKDLADTYSNEIQEELTSILLLQKLKLEKAEVC
ncbi:MAG: hypothetical protein GF353_20970 [Candidatus Lokiarchaeota archaeon]|nr:hypothetical protein [Candidatus Lokiarchaeota archaeon]